MSIPAPGNSGEFPSLSSGGPPFQGDGFQSTAYEGGQAVVRYVGGAGASDSNLGLVSSQPFATVGAALAGLPSSGGQIVVAPNAITAETLALNIDVTKVSLKGERSNVTWAAIPGAGYCIRFYSGSSTNAYGGSVVVSDGITYGHTIGSGQLTGTCIQLGDGINNAADFLVANGGVAGVSRGVSFQSNTFRLAFDKFDLTWSGIDVPTNLTMFGESMVWRDSLFTNINQHGNKMFVGSGEWDFDGCKFDGAPLVADGGGSYGQTVVTLTNCHQENPQLDIYYYLTAQNNARIDVRGGAVIVDDPGSNFGQGLFNSASTNTAPEAGIYVHAGVTLPWPIVHLSAQQSGWSQLIDGTGPGWIVDPDWILLGATGAPTLINGFTNGSPSVAYRMLESGIVLWRGTTTGGTAFFNCISSLPTRYRPKVQNSCPIPTGSGNSVIVDAAGNVSPSVAAPSFGTNCSWPVW